jgi:hypothetical protein
MSCIGDSLASVSGAISRFQGADGEVNTATELAKLETDGWFSIHDGKFPGLWRCAVDFTDDTFTLGSAVRTVQPTGWLGQRHSTLSGKVLIENDTACGARY